MVAQKGVFVFQDVCSKDVSLFVRLATQLAQ